MQRSGRKPWWAITVLGIACLLTTADQRANAGDRDDSRVAGGVTALARAGQVVSGCVWRPVSLFAERCCSPHWCRDDYCPKLSPCVFLRCVRFGCHDYCGKPVPCLRLPASCGCGDNYCPKPAPWIPPPSVPCSEKHCR